MSRLRLVIMLGCCCAAAFVMFAVIDSAASGPGEGEVSVILHGGFIMIGLGLTGFLALVAALCLLWHKIWIRRVLLVCTVGPAVVTAGFIVASQVAYHQSQKAHLQQLAEQQARRDEIDRQVVPISNGYLRRLSAPEFEPPDIHALRDAFYAEMAQSGIEGWARSNPKHHFDMVTDLYAMTLGTPDGVAVPEPILGGLLYDPVCYSFFKTFAQDFSARQGETFAQYCPDWLIEREQAAAE